MSHSFNKSDGTFPHKKDGGVLGYPSKGAKSKAVEKSKSKIDKKDLNSKGGFNYERPEKEVFKKYFKK